MFQNKRLSKNNIKEANIMNSEYVLKIITDKLIHQACLSLNSMDLIELAEYVSGDDESDYIVLEGIWNKAVELLDKINIERNKWNSGELVDEEQFTFDIHNMLKDAIKAIYELISLMESYDNEMISNAIKAADFDRLKEIIMTYLSARGMSTINYCFIEDNELHRIADIEIWNN